jgi:hypothetical protein
MKYKVDTYFPSHCKEYWKECEHKKTDIDNVYICEVCKHILITKIK